MTYPLKSHSISRSDNANGDFQWMYSADVIKDNAYVAASCAGLEKNEITVLQRSLPPRYDLRRLKNNESLKLLLQKKAGQSRVAAYRSTSGKFNYTAYRILDKKFYNLSDTGSRARLDYPPPVTARLSSPFNPAHLNLMSGRVSPHNGIDHSMSTNTKTVSVINGKATRAEYNSTTGYFVEVLGKDNIKTRYLRLSKILVKKGTPVSWGTAIALSGNSGRSPGPYLHYELVINNSPVDSLAFRVAEPADNNRLEQYAYVHARDYGRYLDRHLGHRTVRRWSAFFTIRPIVMLMLSALSVAMK